MTKDVPTKRLPCSLFRCIDLSALKLAVTIAFLHLLVLSSPAQKTFISKHITVNDGLPQGFVSGIVQDNDGFIWLGTRDGLARYDGREFKVFYSNDRRATNISSNIITGLYRDHRNRIWILHESKAIDVLYPREERFEAFTSDSVYQAVYKHFSPNFISVDSQDNVWLIDPGNGLWKISLNAHRVHHLSKREGGLLCDTVRGIIEAPDKSYWVFMQKGVQQLDQQNKVTHSIPFGFPVAKDININRNFAAGLTMADDNTILIREMNGIFLFDTKQFAVREIPIDKGLTAAVPPTTQPQREPGGNLYVEAMSDLYQYDVKEKKAVKVWGGALEQAQSFLIDRSGVAWFGNSASGLRILNLRSLPFQSYIYTSGFFVDLLGQLDLKLDKARWIPHPLSQQYARDIQTRYDYSSKGELWIVSGAHSAVADPQTKTFTELPLLEGNDPAFYFTPMTISNDTCWRVYAFTGNPVYYDARKKTWTYPLGTTWRLTNPTNILDIVKTGNTIWATTKHDGLVCINVLTGETHWYKQERNPESLPTNELTDLERDPIHDSVVWIGTRAGLVRFNMQRGKSVTFTAKNGLPNNTVYCIAADEKGFLWLSTNKGLCRFDPVSFAVQNFSSSDGLQGDEFNSFHKLKLPDGRIAFGGTAGFTVFDPLQFVNDTFQPDVRLTRVKINNQEADLGAGGALKSLLDEPATLALDYDQNFITFYFAGLQFNNVEKIQYRYRLNGFDKQWNYSGHLGMANYTKLPPGDYTLELNATNTSGVWSSNIRQVLITIDPPLWETTGAYLFYALLFISAIFGYMRYTEKKMRLENLVDLKNREAEQLKQLGEIKNRFFTNITHEFRTPLTLIISPLEQLLKGNELPEADKKQLRLIQQNSRQLLQLINQLLDLSKLEAGVMQTSLTPVDIEKLLEGMVMPFYSIAASNHVALLFQSEVSGHEYFIDKDKLERIVTNLLSNAIKFTSAGGRIEMVAKNVDSRNGQDLISLRIADTGIGIPASALPRIFDRFYQADDMTTRTYEGTGIGLSLVKELTNLLKGTITVESAVDKGTVFTVTLPLERSGKVTTEISNGKVITPLNEAGPVEHHPHETITSHDASKPLILIAEDNDQLRGFLAGQLAKTYSVITAANGNDAWDQAVKEMPELIVTDVMMPFMDGITLSKKVRETEDTSHIGLIMLTAKASVEHRIEGLQTGVNDYIAKPFSFDELQLRIANLLGHQKKQRAYFYNQLLRNSTDQSPAPAENEFLTKAYGFLGTALEDKRSVGVEDLASHFSMSARTLNRKLTALVGVTASEFIRNYRLSRATTLLVKDLTVAEVAYQVGFDSPQYFAQCFKALYGVTPTEYVQQQSGKN